jgi:hypothetical protein
MWRADYKASMKTRHRHSSIVFPKCLSVGRDWYGPGHGGGKCRIAASPKLFMFREAGTQVSLVTMSHPSLRTTAPPCLPLDIKDSLEEDTRLLFWELFA